MFLVLPSAICLLLLPPLATSDQQNATRALVQRIVNGELAADARDYSRWMFRDANSHSGKSTVKLIVQTAEGNIARTVEINGHPLTAQEQRDDAEKMRQFVTDPSIREKQRRDQQEDGDKLEH